MKNYLDIVVAISPGTAGDYAVRVTSDEFGQHNSTVKLPFTLEELSRTVFGEARQIGTIVPKGSGSGAAGRKSAEDFGVELFDALFQGKARDLLTSAQTRAQDNVDTGVRIRLYVDLRAPGMATVASLPWELMCRSRTDHPMALSTQTTLVRALDTMGRTEPAPFLAPLRIMVLMSNPSGTTTLDLDKERKQIEATWGAQFNVKVDFVPPIAEDIRQRLRTTKYHVIHYMGHGDFDNDGVGRLLLEKHDKSADPVTGEDFALWVRDQPLRLVFLNACETGKTRERSGLHPFAGVATALINERVPAVVAMQFPISDPAAIVFAKTFYECILNRDPVDAAVVEGRKELRLKPETSSEWATPVLYLRSKGGVLFELKNEDAPVVPQGPAHVVPASAWGASADDQLRLFLTTPDPYLARRHAKLSQELKRLSGVRVVDSVPISDINAHAAAVDALVRSADLCIHLLGAGPGLRLDDDDGRPLRTYPLVELEIARQAARSQLVVMTSEDKASIGNKDYAALIDELAALRRDKGRFELAILDKNRIADTVQAKLEELRRARQAKVPDVVGGAPSRRAFVDSHVTDEELAIDLVAYLVGRDVNTDIRTTSALVDAPADSFKQLDETVRKSSLYVIVAGKVDRDWVSNRKVAILKSAVRTKAALLIAKYSATPGEGSDDVEVTRDRFEISSLKDADASWVDALFAPAGGQA
jgi:hypothetical protein